MPALQDGKHLKVQVFCFYEDGGGLRRVLILRYGEAKGGFWQPVTGSVEEGETPQEAALREAHEETGAAVPSEALVDTGYEFEFEAWGKRYREFAFGLRVPDESVTLSHEHQDYRWCSESEAFRMIRWETNKEGLRRLIARLDSKK